MDKYQLILEVISKLDNKKTSISHDMEVSLVNLHFKFINF